MTNPLPSGPFGTALADPGWLWRAWSARGEGKSPQHYRCGPVTEIAALQVAQIMAQDSVLFIWTTFPLIFQVQSVITAWGFQFSALAWVWVKFNPVTGKYAFGTGYGTRKNVEPCLLARRGNPRRLNRGIRDFIIAPRRRHSEKPDEQYALIEALFPGPYIELFDTKEEV
jgi:N6-adenosine-specific RNA methylase IME4